MADPRIIHISLDENRIASADSCVDQDRRIAIFDLVEQNRFEPQRTYPDGYAGPYRIALRIEEGRLAIAVKRADDTPLETFMIGLTRFRRPIRDYLAICDSYHQARHEHTPHQMETIDMARRALHNEAAELLRDRLAEKIVIDFETARRLITLICALHAKS